MYFLPAGIQHDTERILLVSFLNVTALRSDYHYLYVSPAAPFGILIVACAVAKPWRQVRPTTA
ncbi:hypothetical protein [Azospirillum sp. Sh1]|uniref:hypothetical protein n=1 Tax=Azospirillum sp. Sh1 TaxID=2607285 RepID=UPI0011ED59F3|nr:hypothetical protein [Azospirillum sp. Sh1]KAA0579873.1 hypothetical protein FZ029_05985 [Azospirillum sp. Sh1]